ncbi:multi-sensor signal transduction histidine kinase [[Leptolyngbya] sp. PCC 7376]|uniref:ATP-binding protein n=1 Tax=[Leptolyngbya] sp. PCC 7376 TaxID=111781 RepID=UPI00029F2352|nr:ATP-binding protein [[Leptolyngbya] sp. PCC 7376]AFY39373.1 multi-sensor signal transduction histidine kinase [[Leptolyngbya] sp. PCC 7376]
MHEIQQEHSPQEPLAASSQVIGSEFFDDFAAIFKASQAIASCLETDELLWQLSKIFLKFSHCDRCGVFLCGQLDENSTSLQLKAIATPKKITLCAIAIEAVEDFPIQLIDHVKETQQTQIISQKQKAPVQDPYLEKYQSSNVLCLPLLLENRMIKGLIYLEHQTKDSIWNEHDLETLDLLGKQGAIALANAYSYEQEKRNSYFLKEQFLELKKREVLELAGVRPDKVQERLAFLIKQNPIGIVEWSTSYKIMGWNPAAEKIFGYDAVEMLGHHAEQILPEEVRPLVAKVMSDIMQDRGGYYSLNQNIRKNGTVITCEWFNTPLRDHDDNIIGVLSMVQDITEREQIQASILQKTTQLERALQELQKAQLQLVQSEKMSTLGNLVAGIAHEINNPTGFIKGNISHAQNYVNDLLGLIDFLVERCPDDDKEVEIELEVIELDFVREDLLKLLDSMNLGVDRIRNISDGLRTFSRKDRINKVNFNVHDGINSTLLILKHRTKGNEERPKIQIETAYNDIPTIECFPGQLNQVFMNLLANAIDAFDEINQGRSFKEIEADPNRITIETAECSEHIQIKIQDNACGMKPETQQRIFEQGFTTKEVGKGTGLGMAIAHQIITEKHNGSITCDSQLGEGTIFTIELPILGI